MPYKCFKEGKHFVLRKYERKSKGKVVGTHSSEAGCQRQMRALYYHESPKNEYDLMAEGRIGWDFLTDEFIEKLRHLDDGSDNPINVSVNSPGGSVDDGIAIYNAINECSRPVHVIFNGKGVSTAAWAFLSADQIEATENSLFYLHPPKLASMEELGEDEYKKRAELLGKVKDIIVNTIAGKTKREKSELEDTLKETKWMTAYEAYDFGIVDDVLPTYSRVDVDNLSGAPEKIVNYFVAKNEEVSKMALSDIANRLEIEVKDDADDKTIEEAIVNTLSTLREEIKTLKDEASKTPDPEPDPTPAPKLAVPKGLVNTVITNRESRLQNLLGDGKITPPVLKGLMDDFCTVENLQFDENWEVNDGFDKVVKRFEENESVVNFEGGGVGVLEKVSDEENVLVKQAKARAAAAKE